MTEPHMVELRGMCPRETVDVLDAVSLTRDISRTALVNEILGKWTAQKVHEANAICAVRK
jgi:hypothetical protein